MHTGALCNFPFDRDGKHTGVIEIPYSVDRSPFFRIQLPVCHIQNGDGPSVLIMAGVHGDEYEGKLTLSRMIREIEHTDIQGSLIILPAANAPAVFNATRCSPYDDGNLNRVFPGKVDGGPTERIAYVIENELMAGRDYVFDLHSGGTSMAHLDCSLCEIGYGEERDGKAIELLQKMAMPFALTADNGSDSPTSLAAANRCGAVAVSGEFGGGGAVSNRSLDMTGQTVDRFMMATGLTKTALISEALPSSSTTFITQAGPEGLVIIDRNGWFEPRAEVGDRVSKGMLAGLLIDLVSPTHPPVEVFFGTDGVVTSRRLHCEVRPGDCIYSVANII